MACETMDKDDTCWSVFLKVYAPPDFRETYSIVALSRGTTTVKPVGGIARRFVGVAAIVRECEI